MSIPKAFGAAVSATVFAFIFYSLNSWGCVGIFAFLALLFWFIFVLKMVMIVRSVV